ncbi:MAG: nicotinate-nicotinamide nucleotide adenylyltransferase [Actinomycetota bacterium]
MAVTGLYGGAFDPPHVGHVALGLAAKQHFGLPRLLVLVSAQPAHKGTHLDAETRLELARAAFPDDEVRLDPYPRTIELLRGERFEEPLFVVGADEFCDFLAWSEPDAVLELAELGVGTRPGFPRERLDAVLDRLRQPDRVHFFDLVPNAAASTAIRASGDLELVPAPVAEIIRERGLYRP